MMNERDRRLVESAERRDRALSVLASVAHKEQDEGRKAPQHDLRRIFAGEEGAVLLMRSIPGFAGLWEREVPMSYLRGTRDRGNNRWVIASCTCGEHVALKGGALADCACGRWFLHAGKSVRVKRFDQQPQEAA